MLAGLRADVDTLRGASRGVPRLLNILERFGLKATFFFSVGPDNMGRHLRRLIRPAFLWKMLRTNAPGLYGWSILRYGLFGSGPDIGRRTADLIRRTAEAGHEAGLHAWDHHRWQTMDLSAPGAAERELRLGYDRLTEILGRPPTCSAAPAWRAPAAAVMAKGAFPFAYNSDCRGHSCFRPLLDGRDDWAPQVPVTLPTYDELAGRQGLTDADYNSHLLELFRPRALNVLCIHAEVEGLAKAPLFEDFLRQAQARGLTFGRLDEVLAAQGELRTDGLTMRSLPGRAGNLAFQAGAAEETTGHKA